jgi:hypothetical protein
LVSSEIKSNSAIDLSRSRKSSKKIFENDDKRDKGMADNFISKEK